MYLITVTAIGAIVFPLQIELSFALQTYLIPSMNDVDSPPDCNGVCVGSWNSWNNWSACQSGRNCHVIPGRQIRNRACYILVTPSSPSRGDGHEETPQAEWQVKCRDKGSRPCADERTCAGLWGEWGPWTSCGTSTSRTNTTCYKSRHRVCLDFTMVNRINSDSCYGGLHADTDYETCTQDPCFLSQQTSAPIPIPPDIKGKASGGKPDPVATKSGGGGGNVSKHHTMIILAVSLGSVVFGVVFIILLINLIRQSSNSRRARNTSRQDQWKRMTSTTTTSYVAASEIASSRMEFSEVRSPSSMTVTSGESSSSSTSTNGNACPFTRNDSVFIYSAADSNGVTLNEFTSKPRRSRYVQDNVYWEITDQSHNAHLSEVSSEQNREEVPNVLYDADA